MFFNDMLEIFSLPLGCLEPIIVHIQGCAGSGKSYLIKTLIEGVKYITEKRKVSIDPKQPTLVVGAPTNNAASIIDGKTIHSLLGFGFLDEEKSLHIWKQMDLKLKICHGILRMLASWYLMK